MMERDDKLLKQFFTEQKQEIADEGFTRRVISRLPDNVRRLSTIWSSFCGTIAVILFFVFDGPKLLSDVLREVFIAAVQTFATTTIDLKTLLIVAFGLLLVGANRLFSTE